ncbi:MAG: hypothetical protein AUJ72_02335 [Candidatus Omnitrophica bacterium CG1_02_46_14]|nr:MAG: hypothetical protein AUJ72_02335 [Candidatus Omnitrophica bacterium CG1_02_46_14]
MPKIKAFKGWRYQESRVGDLAGVLAPPYDVISLKQQKALYQKSPYNVVRLILGKINKKDSTTSNQYTRAHRYLNEWISGGVLSQDSRPSIYVYAEDYSENGKTQTRVGFMAAMKADETSVLKHENTLTKPKKDRIALLREVQTNLSPIFGLFEDPRGEVQKILKETLKLKPVINVTLDGVRHRLYVENRPDPVNRVLRFLKAKPVFIADGHHRFEVACEFKRWIDQRMKRLRRRPAASAALPADQSANEKNAGWDYVMTYFTDFKHNPFQIFPTHRLISISKSVKDPWTDLKKRGALKKVSDLRAVLTTLSKTRETSKHTGYLFGIYNKKEGFFIFELSPHYLSQVKNNPVDRLDVAVLHRMLIEPCFKIKSIEKSSAIDFTRDAEEAQELVDQGRFDLALFLRPTSLNEMILVSKKGLKMPQKSTYFYPKLLSGLVFHRFENEKEAVK